MCFVVEFGVGVVVGEYWVRFMGGVLVVFCDGWIDCDCGGEDCL